LAYEKVENSNVKRLKVATSKDFTLMRAIPVSKFAAKIGVKGVKSVNDLGEKKGKD
jgi:hypothetical protein